MTETKRRLLPLGRVTGHRGRGGELTVKVFRGEADPWTGLREVWIGDADPEEGSPYEVQRSRAYKDRLVLKLCGIEDSTAAEALRGRRVAAPVDQAPALPPGRYYAALLVGLEVRDPDDRRIGRVVDVMPTGASDLLVIDPADEPNEREAQDAQDAKDDRHETRHETLAETERPERGKQEQDDRPARETRDDTRANGQLQRRPERKQQNNQQRHQARDQQRNRQRDEVLVPLVDAIVEEVDEVRGVIRIRPPEGLLELNRSE